MTGSSIFDYVHQADHAEIAEQLGLSLTGRPGQAGLNSPASGSEEGSQHGTNNPDGEFDDSLYLNNILEENINEREIGRGHCRLEVQSEMYIKLSFTSTWCLTAMFLLPFL